jgi:transketolase C-terminal domain/subunit
MTRLATTDKRVVVLSGDIGNKLFDKLKAVDEKRFYNCGIAEANMMGVAAGMAMSGLRDRGGLVCGQRADMARVRLHETLPVVRQVWCAGERTI